MDEHANDGLKLKGCRSLPSGIGACYTATAVYAAMPFSSRGKPVQPMKKSPPPKSNCLSVRDFLAGKTCGIFQKRAQRLSIAAPISPASLPSVAAIIGVTLSPTLKCSAAVFSRSGASSFSP